MGKERFILTRTSNPETHAYGDVIFVFDKKQNKELPYGFRDQDQVFEHIIKEYYPEDIYNNIPGNYLSMFESLYDEQKEKIIERIAFYYKMNKMNELF